MALTKSDRELWKSIDNKNSADLNKAIKQGANVNSFNEKLFNSPLLKASFHGLTDIVEILLNNGANVDWQNRNGITALMYASQTGREDIVFMLLEFGANIRLKSDEDMTALDIAKHQGNHWLYELLENSREQQQLQAAIKTDDQQTLELVF